MIEGTGALSPKEHRPEGRVLVYEPDSGSVSHFPKALARGKMSSG